jgi:multidrug efflux pump subunit AcrA (membrane-fusion protein)
MTDDLVAEKDREIAQLQEKLESNPLPEANEPSESELYHEAVDADEAIIAQRAKLAELEEKMTEQLRQAELEMSINRAKIAREQAEVADARIEIDNLRSSLPEAGSDDSGGKGAKGKWFSKLGLGKDE